MTLKVNWPGEFVPSPRTISRAKKLDSGPIVLADHGDNCGAGGTTDVMAVLEEVMAQGLENVAAGPFCDPSAVQELINAGE
jgi:microcystin degradation protein MlrC